MKSASELEIPNFYVCIKPHSMSSRSRLIFILWWANSKERHRQSPKARPQNKWPSTSPANVPACSNLVFLLAIFLAVMLSNSFSHIEATRIIFQQNLPRILPANLFKPHKLSFSPFLLPSSLPFFFLVIIHSGRDLSPLEVKSLPVLVTELSCV